MLLINNQEIIPPFMEFHCRSASKERPRDSTTEENEYLETELNNILRGQNINNNNNNNQQGFEKTNGSGRNLVGDEKSRR